MSDGAVELDGLTLGPDPASAPAAGVQQPAVGGSLNDAERQLILATLERCGGDKKKAAEILGISLKTLYNRLHLYAKS